MNTVPSSIAPATGATARRIGAAVATAAVAAGVLFAGIAPVQAADPASGCQSGTALENGGFENPALPAQSYTITPSVNVPGWESTDPAGIEIWSSGFFGVPAAVGNQFAELNATEAGTLYQEVATQPGQALQWSLLHRARAGVDTMDVLIGAPGAEMVSQGDLTDDTTAWGRHTGIYIVPAGQTVTRFGFRAVRTGSGNPSIGNFLDDISFGTGACIVSQAAVANATRQGDAVHVGDEIEYAITVRNDGGSRALLASMSNALPAGIEFVPGSLRTTTGPATGGKTDAAADDSAEYDPSARTVSTRLGDGATASEGGSIAPGETTTFVFRARVLAASALSSISNAFVVEYTDSLSGIRTFSATPTVETPVSETTDRAVALETATNAPVAGGAETATWTATLTNNGPQDDSDVRLGIDVPAQLSDPEVRLDGGAICPIVDTRATCPVGELAVGDVRHAVIRGTIGADVPSGTVLAVAATSTGSVFDSDPANDGASATSVVASDSDLWMSAADAPQTTLGRPAALRFTVGNTGRSNARGVVMQLEVPEGFDASPSDGSIDENGVWSIPSLAAGRRAFVTLSGTPTAEGWMETAAWLTSSETADDHAGNERAVAGVFVVAERIDTTPVPVGVDTPAEPAPSTDPAPSVEVGTDASAEAGAAASAKQENAAALAFTGATGVTTTSGLAALMLAGGVLLFVARRRPASRHRA